MNIPHVDLVALAAALTGLLAVPLAILTFFTDRGLRETKSLEGLRTPTALAVAAAGLYTLACDLAGWWSWHRAIPSSAVLAGVRANVFMAIVFAPPALFAFTVAAWAVLCLLGRLLGWIRSSPA